MFTFIGMLWNRNSLVLEYNTKLQKGPFGVSNYTIRTQRDPIFFFFYD